MKVKIINKPFLLLLFLSMLILTNCAGTGGGLGSIKKTNQLVPGMSHEQVRNVLGEPSQTQFIGNKWVWKYSLHQYWRGWVPYYLVFSKESLNLEAWYADEAEYMRQQQLWLQAFPPKQEYDVNVHIK